MTPDQLRQKYLQFFASKNHVVIPSASLVPENDPTTLFTSSGMQPLMPYFLGQLHPEGDKITNSQKCFRSQDIEEVGDNRHTCFFEMLGNWSFGDYFKEDQLSWFFEFLTQEIGLDPHRLYVSVYRGDENIGVPRDEESPKIWKRLFEKNSVEAKIIENPEKQGVAGRIFYYGNKNWWSRSGEPNNMPAGEPGGPDSEVFYDFGEEYNFHQDSPWKNEVCHPNCDCGRFLEIGNSVFMQYQKQVDGSFVELPKKNVDFGGGLERILAAVNNNPDVFQTDFFLPIIKKLEIISGKKYLESQEITKSFRVIADHIRGAAMLIADGVIPSNKEQGYFVRRLIRRSIRHGRKLGIDQFFLNEIALEVIDIYQQAYPKIITLVKRVTGEINNEEKKFSKALDRGLKNINKGIKKVKQRWNKLASEGGALPVEVAKEAFQYYQEDGVPIDIFLEEVENLFDRSIFAFWAMGYKGGLQMTKSDVENKIKQEFEKIRVHHAAQSRSGSVEKFSGGLADHSEQTVKYHTATHLLHAALRKILGEKVGQKGSNITKDRLRFDFTFDRSLTTEEKKQVEDLINKWIKAELPVHKQIMDKNVALKSGAVAFFGEKYPDQVSVYTIGFNVIGNQPEFDLSKKTGWISRELCGGPHVTNTREIGKIKLLKEKSVSSGVRRVYLQ